MVTPSPQTLHVDITADGAIQIAGDLDAATAPRLRAVLVENLAASPHRLVLDVSALGFCDSTGLAVLVEAHNQLPTPSQLVLRGAGDQLRRLLHVTHLDTTFTLT